MNLQKTRSLVLLSQFPLTWFGNAGRKTSQWENGLYLVWLEKLYINNKGSDLVRANWLFPRPLKSNWWTSILGRWWKPNSSCHNEELYVVALSRIMILADMFYMGISSIVSFSKGGGGVHNQLIIPLMLYKHALNICNLL